ncbi:MAG: peptidyl-prolyl cis-trans isomerase [Planctomycetota bacterium]
MSVHRTIAAPLFLLLLTVPCAAQSDTGAFVAIVRGDPITRYELEREYRLHRSAIQGDLTDEQTRELRRRVLDRMIMEVLLLQRCDQEQIEVSDRDLERYLDFELDRIRKEGHPALDRREYLRLRGQQTGRTEDEARASIRDEIRIARLYRAQVFRDDFVSPQELRAHYRANQVAFSTEPVYKFRMLLIWRTTPDFQETVDKVRAELNAGADFADLVKKYSEGPQKSEGGLYERTDKELDSFHKPLRDAIRALATGAVSEPVGTPRAVHLVRLEEKKAGSLLSFGEAQESIREAILSQRRTEQRNRFEGALQDEAKDEIQRLLRQ